MKKPIKYHYTATVHYSEEDEGYLAKIPAFENCIGFGETPAQAIEEAYDGLGGIIAVMGKEGIPLPSEDHTATLLRNLKPFIKITQLAQRIGMQPSTLSSKVARGGPFKSDERLKIEQALKFTA